MCEVIKETANLLSIDQPKVDRGGYILHTKDDWYKIVEEWYDVHPDWTVTQLYIGIKFYNYLFPQHVSIDMIHNAEQWTK